MTKKEERKLNEKIARWCGKEEGYITLMGIRYKPYTESLDALFKDAVPKFLEKGWLVRVQFGNHVYEGADGSSKPLGKDGKPTGYASLYNTHPKTLSEKTEFYAVADTPEMALCKAIEQYIDEEKNKK
jgi:hypothetical protein